MTIAQAGSVQDFLVGLLTFDNVGTVSSTITVPADAELVVVALTAEPASTGAYFSGGTVTFTKGGSDTAMTYDAGEQTSWNGLIWHLALPDTGANKSLKWDWAGSGAHPTGALLWTISFWKGIDTAAPIRDVKSVYGTTFPVTTASLTCVSGDLIVAFCGFTKTDGGATAASINSWSGGLTTLAQFDKAGDYNDGAWATGSPSGNTTVGTVTGTNCGTSGDACVVTAISLKPAAGGTILVGDYTLDAGLAALDTLCDKMFVCGASPTSYSDATSGANSLGSKNWGAGAAFGSPAARSGGGRQITSTAITDGSISTNGTVAFWAAVDSANSRLLASGSLSGGKAVTVGQVFTLGALTFGIPNA